MALLDQSRRVKSGHLPSLFYIAVVFWFIGSDVGIAEPKIEDIALSVGESTILQFEPGADIQVSRRGVVDLVHRGNGQWLVTAMQSGIISLSGGSKDQNQHKILRITPKGERPDLGESALPDWICTDEMLSCDQRARLVEGVSANATRLLQARTWCLNNNCRFFAKLTEPARRTLEAMIRGILPTTTGIRLSSTGVLSLEVECQGGNIDKPSLQSSIDEHKVRVDDKTTREIYAALRGRIDDRDIIVSCATPKPTPVYRLETKVLRLSKSEFANLGFDTSSNLALILPGLQIDANLKAKLEAAARSRQIETIGEPAIRLIPGRFAEVRSGGEFLVSAPSTRRDDRKSSWKPFGLTLRAQVAPRNADLVQLTYDLTLSARDQDGISVQEVKGDLDLILGVPTIAAGMDLVSSDLQVRSHTLWAQIPIIGPIFKHNGNGWLHSRVLAWFKLSRDDTPALRSPHTAWPDATPTSSAAPRVDDKSNSG